MLRLWGFISALQSLVPYGHTSPEFGIKPLRSDITPAPDLGTLREWVLTPARVLYRDLRGLRYLRIMSKLQYTEFCTSKIADLSTYPTSNVRPPSTIHLYALDGTLTLYGNPTSLVIGYDTLIPGATQLL